MNVRLPSNRTQLLALPVIVLVALHFWILTLMPPLYIDEVATSVHTDSMTTRGADFNGNNLPLMSRSFGGGYTTNTYLYPLTAWASLLGTSDFALRAFSQFAVIIAIGFVSASLYLWLGKRAGYIGLLIGLTLPWAWINGSVAWDPAITPLYISVGIFVFSLLVRRELSSLKRAILMAALTTLLVLTAYSYPPARASAPLLLVVALTYFATRQLLNWRLFLIVAMTGALTSLPLVYFMLDPTALGRSAALSVFSNASIIDGLSALFVNLLSLLHPITLFLTGDPNLRHSTGFQGMLGASSLIAFGLLIYVFTSQKRPNTTSLAARQLLTISVVGIAISLLGSALTTEGQPHYLRATMAWPFFVILITIGWMQVKRLPVYWRQLVVLVAALLVTVYIVDLTMYYPERADSVFGANARSEREAEFIDYYQSRIAP